MISANSLKRSAYVTILYAAISIPLGFLSFLVGFAEATDAISGFASRLIGALANVIGMALYVYVLSSLRSLLEEWFSFNAISGLITGRISLYIALAVLVLLTVPFAALVTPVGIISLLALIVYGIIWIILGIRLLQLNNDFYGMLKPFSYTTVTAGICYATIIFSPIGILVGMANFIILALIFFRASKEIAALETGNTNVSPDRPKDSSHHR